MEASGDRQFCPLVFRGVMEGQAEIEDAVDMAPVAREIGPDGISPVGKDLLDQVVSGDNAHGYIKPLAFVQPAGQRNGLKKSSVHQCYHFPTKAQAMAGTSARVNPPEILKNPA